jgi:hypothetical protein
MPSFANMVDEVSGYLRAYSSDQEAKTFLVSSVTDTATSLTVNDPDRASAGLAEVDEELVEISAVDSVTGVATLFPWGRGQQGTTAVAHAANARVTTSPRWPRARIKRTLNEVLGGMFPDLFAVKTTQLTATSALDTEYGLPADVRRIISMRWNFPPYGWQEISGWRMGQSGDIDQFPTGTSVQINDDVWPGQTIHIVYAAEPLPLVNDADDYAATTGLPETSSDVLCIGAAARLVVASDLAATQVMTVEHAQRIDGRPVGGASAASRYLMQLYQTRLIAERNRLIEHYPLRMRRTW